MTFSEEHNERILRLLKKDADRRNYMREYQKEYRRKKKVETGESQKQYYDLEDMRRRSKEKYQQKSALCDIKFLFI